MFVKINVVVKTACKNPHRHSEAGEESHTFIEFLTRRISMNISTISFSLRM
jgi:hypothetical protein